MEKNDIINYFRINFKNKNLIYVNINKGNINYYGNIKQNRLIIINKFLNDVIKKKPLTVSFLLSLKDEVYDTDIDVYDLRKNKDKIDNPNMHKFDWGISQSNNNVLRIEKSKKTNFNFPIFSFSKTEFQKEIIIIPHINLINNNFLKDNIYFSEKKKIKPIARFSNVRANLYLESRFKLLELSYFNKDIIDCKGGFKDKHPGHNDYIIHPTFINLYKKLNIIDKSIDNNKFLELLKTSNYIEKKELTNKFLICNDSWYNSCDYALLNSVLLRYKLDKTKYFEDFIFQDNEDYIIFDENNYKNKYNYINSKNDTFFIKKINNRKKKVNDYLRYNKLVDIYTIILEKFSRIQFKNQI